MRENKRDFGLFFTDASFDHKSKTAVIGILNADNNKTYSSSIKAKTPLEAEEFGIERSMNIAISEKIFNLIIFCDNKIAINKYKKIISTKKLYEKFWKIQLVWLPREYNQIADLLSKNIDENDIEALKELQEDNLTNRVSGIENKISKKYIKDIKVSKENTAGSLLLRIKQFKALFDLLEVKDLKSEIIKELILDTPKLLKVEEMILEPEHIEDFEEEIKRLEDIDPYTGVILKAIRDTIIFL